MLRKSLVLAFVLAFASTAPGAVQFFINNHAGWVAALGPCNNCCLEHFATSANTPTFGLDCLVPPLQQAVPNVDPMTGTGFPTGLFCGFCMYSSYLSPTCDLVSLGTNFVGNHSTMVGANAFAASTIADFSNCGGLCPDYGGYCAVAFDVIDGLNTQARATIDVYDDSSPCVLVGSTTVLLSGPTTPMNIGVIYDRIGKIDIVCTSGELTDNWELCIPEPVSLCLLALGGLVLLRRR